MIASTLRVRLRLLAMVICVLLTHLASHAQHDTTIFHPRTDTIRTYDTATERLINSFKRFGIERAKKSSLEYEEDTIATKQDELLEEIRRIAQESKSYLKTGIDTTGLSTEIKKLQNWYNVTSEGVFTNTGGIQTNRNLETSIKVLRELLKRTKNRKAVLDEYYRTLVDFRNKIDSLSSEGILYRFSSDSAVLVRYAKKLMVVGKEIAPTDSAFNKALANVSELQATVNRLVNKLNASIEQTEAFRRQLFHRALQREFANLGDSEEFSRPFNEIIRFSWIKASLAFVFYIRNQIGMIFLLLILVFAASIFLRNLKRNLESRNLLNSQRLSQVVLRYPVLSALVIVLTIFQFIFLDPPFIFNALIWSISSIALAIILRDRVSRFWSLAWMTMFALFVLASVDNLILQASITERWIMMALSIIGVIAGITILIKSKRQERKEKLIMFVLGFLVVLEIGSIICNLNGLYNFSKTLFMNGFFSVVIAVLFLWTIRFINEGLLLASEAYRIPDKKVFYINFERIGKKAPPVFYLLLIVGWFVLFGSNFYAYRFLEDPIMSSIREERKIGSFSFTIEGILLFALIIFLAGLISKIVSFFASDKHREEGDKNRKSGIGSWLLLIRITIITLGLLLAFAAAGIPMDKVTIILSALSVGIGFGLQTLVNNLVSGLIISFEKPVNVGDLVEIGTKSGIVKSIGFRSSVLSTGNGSDVVIPNGDLLNQHLVNWTRGDLNKKVDILLGVAYGSNLEQVIQILKDLPVKDERVLSSPGPSVNLKGFNTSSIDVQLSFWVRNLNESSDVRSDVLLAIDNTFKENGIEIPFPRQDLHIRTEKTPTAATLPGLGGQVEDPVGRASP